MTAEEIKDKYVEVEYALEDAIDNFNEIELIGEDENIELDAIKNVFDNLNTQFKQEIDKLENSSEWDKFCIAFFGETNAGKSTVVEALRIIYDEEERQKEILKQENEYKKAIREHSNEFQNLIDTLQQLNNKLDSKYVAFNKIIFGIVCIIVGIIVGCLMTHIL